MYTYHCDSSCTASTSYSSGVSTTISCCQTNLCNTYQSQDVSTTSSLKCYVGTVRGTYYGTVTTCSSGAKYCVV